VTFKPPFTEGEVGFIRKFIDKYYPSELAFKISSLNQKGKLGIESYGLVRTERGVREQVKRIKKEIMQPVSSSAGYASGY